jgi:hypothetical protein
METLGVSRGSFEETLAAEQAEQVRVLSLDVVFCHINGQDPEPSALCFRDSFLRLPSPSKETLSSRASHPTAM